MKKMIMSAIMCLALIASTSVMAQDAKAATKKDCKKEKTCTKGAEKKSCCKEKKDCPKTTEAKTK